jgi:FixJ family two-component response regulator
VDTVRPHIVVVDNDVSFRRALTRLLVTVGFSVDAFESAEEFLELRREVPECLVLDVRLGGMSGFDLHERLSLEGPVPPTIFIAARDDDATREHARRVSSAQYLPKPLDDAVLIGAIDQVTGQRRR